ncbi:MAG: ABC transporter permease [Acidimicrobiales bacterium]|nr:ABC transporter permease [Acidimicrobiales bacterium]
MMLLSIRNIRRNKLRFGMTTFAVLLGVSFVVASFVLSDGLRSALNSMIETGFGGTDAQVRAESDFDEIAFTDRPIDEALVEVVAGVQGVEVAYPNTDTLQVVVLGSDASPLGSTTSPVAAVSWDGSDIGALRLVDGKVPGPGEFAMDEGTVDRENLVLGATYTVVGVDGPEPFKFVGVNRFGEEGTLSEFGLVSFPLDELQRLDGSEGLVRYIDVAAAPGVDVEDLVARIELALPGGVEVITNEALVTELQNELGDIIGIFGNVLLAFALVAVFVSTFIIGNTFNILLGQRVRQLSLLRALGASSRQVRFGAVFEALIVGALASILGLAGGIALALGLKKIMEIMGLSLPDIEIIVNIRTLVLAVVVGIGVTLFASLSPARRAAGISPMAGIRAGFRFGSGEGKRRTIIAIFLAVIGGAGIAFGLLGGTDNTALLLSVLGLGAVLTFVAVSMFSPLFSSPSASFLGIPLEHLPRNKITGHMARQNAAKNNKRTASTAAGLMIGLALIAMASVVADSLKSSLRANMESTVVSDFLVTATNQGTFSNRVADRIAELPEFELVSPVRYGNARIDGAEHQVTAGDLALLTDLMDVKVVSGDPANSADSDHILLHSEVAADLGVAVGDSVPVEFARTGARSMTVGAIYDNAFLIGQYMIDLSAWEQDFTEQNDATLSIKLADGVTVDAAKAALQPLEAAFPQLEFETNARFQERVEGQLDTLLIIINVFLALAILIALLGITNTMALAVLERTREIGLMRAIGMTRRQTRSMIRLEAGVVSVFGALLGVVVGIVFGWIAVLAIPGDIIDRLAIPFVSLAVYVVIAAIAGLVAASFPARRASRLNILDSIKEL